MGSRTVRHHILRSVPRRDRWPRLPAVRPAALREGADGRRGWREIRVYEGLAEPAALRVDVRDRTLGRVLGLQHSLC